VRADKLDLEVAIADPRADDVRRLVERHLEYGRTHSPPEDAHALDVDGLLDPAMTLFSIRSSGELVAIGALRQLDDEHAELKTMHTVEHARGGGIGRAMLNHLLTVHRARGFSVRAWKPGRWKRSRQPARCTPARASRRASHSATTDRARTAPT
jgi:putative acetyltransferase